MRLQQEPLTDQNLDDVVAFFRASNPFAQHTWGWDTGRFTDWRWGHNTNNENARPGWFSTHCRVYRDDGDIRAVSVAEYGEAGECIITRTEDPGTVGSVLASLRESHAATQRGLLFECNGEAGWLRAVFSADGLSEEETTGHEWEYRLSDQTAPIEIARGFTIESLADDPHGAYDGINECIRAAFDSKYDFRPGLRTIETNPLFHPGLSLFARSPEGRIAAYLRGTVDPGNGVCGIDPICTHPDFHRLGLGKVVVQTCFNRQRELGGRFSYIGSGPEPAPGTFLYRSLGPYDRADASTWTRP